MSHFLRHLRRASLALALITALVGIVVLPVPALAAAQDVTTVIDNLRNWAMGILAALATLFLTIGGVKYLVAGGNPRAVEEAKGAIRSALIGYVLAALAPLLFSIVKQIVGG